MEKTIGSETDFVHILGEQKSLKITSERERADLRKVVEDVTFSLSELNQEVESFLTGTDAKSIVRVRVFDGVRNLFHGYLDTQQHSWQINQKWTDLRAYSRMKQFWERAGKIKINLRFKADETDLTWRNLVDVLKKNLTERASFRAIFNKVSVPDDYMSARPIRFTGDSDDPLVGNNGRYSDLDPHTTVAELLEAFMKYHNAECFIDDDTGVFTFQRRNGIVYDAQHNLDVLMRDDVEPTHKPYGAKRFDYIYAPVKIVSTPTPIFRYFITVQNGVNPKIDDANLVYYMTSIINGQESPPSLPLALHIPPLNGDNNAGYAVVLTIPAGPVGTTERKIYRSNYDDENPYLLAVIAGNTEVTPYTDSARGINDVAALMPKNVPLIEAGWFGFDETAGAWRNPILDVQGGANTPEGTIFNVIPELRFTLPNDHTTILTKNLFDVFSFFGHEANLDDIHRRWIDIVTSAGIFSIGVKGTGYRVGDSCKSTTRLPLRGALSGILVIKRAQVDAVKEESELEVLVL